MDGWGWCCLVGGRDCPPPPTSPSHAPAHAPRILLSHPSLLPAPPPSPPPRPAPCSDLEQSVRDDVALLKASPVVGPGTPIFGGIYDVKTGAVTILKD